MKREGFRTPLQTIKKINAKLAPYGVEAFVNYEYRYMYYMADDGTSLTSDLGCLVRDITDERVDGVIAEYLEAQAERSEHIGSSGMSVIRIGGAK